MSTNNTSDSFADHSYDGIQEYDNPLPAWWKWLFALSILYAPFYVMYFHNGVAGRSLEDQYNSAQNENTKKQYAEIGTLGADEATIAKFLHEPKWVGVGESIYKANCVSCHGTDGSGNVGPNLCDENFKHIKNLTDIHKVIADGVAGGAMPGWSKRLQHPNDIVLVSVYVASLRGTKQPGEGKSPDGSPIPPWPAQP